MIVEQKVLKPTMPTVIMLEQVTAKKQDGPGFQKLGSIAVKDLTEEQAIEYAELMKETFIEHWKKLSNK